VAADATLSADGIVEVPCTETSHGHFKCGCYDYDAGICGPCWLVALGRIAALTTATSTRAEPAP